VYDLFANSSFTTSRQSIYVSPEELLCSFPIRLFMEKFLVSVACPPTMVSANSIWYQPRQRVPRIERISPTFIMAFKNTTVTVYGSGFYAFLGKEKLLANRMFDRGLTLERDLTPLKMRFNGFPVGAENGNDWPVEIVTDTVLRCTLTFRHDPPPRPQYMGQQMRAQNKRVRVGLYLSDTGEETNYLEVDIRRPMSVIDFGPSRILSPIGM
jgi:hypothetical protein